MDVPAEYAKQGFTTPKEAADFDADVVGAAAVQFFDTKANEAREAGRSGEADFYSEARDILIKEYAEDDARLEEERRKNPPVDDNAPDYEEI